MKILGIDTSSKFLSIAISDNDKIILEESHLLDRKHSSEMVPKIEELLKKIGISIDKIDAFIVGLGPGSFTGLRIGVSAVKGFGVAAKKPCIGVASIDAIASGVRGPYKTIVPIIDAKRMQVYYGIYRKKGYRVIGLSGYRVAPIEKLMDKVKTEAVFLGDGVGLYREKIKRLNKKAVFLEEEYWYPSSGNLIKLGYDRIKRRKKIGLDDLIPIYLYPKDCQVKLK